MDLINAILEQILNGLRTGSIYALIALGYTMVYGIAKMINFAMATLSWSARMPYMSLWAS